MNGYECGMCDCDPCICSEQKREQNILEGKIIIENLWQAMVHLPSWKVKIIKWLWPDIKHISEDILEYYWKNKD